MGAARKVGRLSDAPGGRSAGRLASRFDLIRLARDESGATAIEYALIASLIFVVIVTSVSLFGTKTTGMMDMIANTIGTAIG
ncbi:MAG: Flp family type IVb pilin [Caulobacteraceae bacterium]